MSIKTYTNAYFVQIEEIQRINKIIELRQPIKRWSYYGEDSECELLEIDEIQSFHFHFCDDHGYPMGIRLRLYSGVQSHIEVEIGLYDDRSESVEFDDGVLMTIPQIKKIEGKYKILYNDNIYELSITNNFTDFDNISKEADKQYKVNLSRRHNIYNNSSDDNENGQFSNEELKEYWGEDW